MVPSGLRLGASFDAIRERLFSLAGSTQAGDGALVVALMSRISGEGVTTVAVGLARAIARAGSLRTLLVDYDFTRRGAAARLGLKARVFSGFSADDDAPPLTDYVQSVEGGRLDVLTLDSAVPSGFAGDELWAASFRALRAAYHVVLVDAGSARSPLPLRWARLAQRRIVVVDTSRTTEEELERLKAELDSVEQHVDAVILNKRKYYIPSFLYRYVR